MPLLAVQIDNNFISLNLYENGQLSFSRFASISAEDYDDSEDYVFEAVNENVFRMLQFQKSKAGSDPIENVVFYGDTHEYVRLTNELEKMGIRTSIINVPPQIHGYENLEFSSYANAIGAMFKRNKETERINLLETDTVNNNKIRSDSSYFVLLGASTLAALGLVLGGWLILKLNINSVQKDIDLINEKKASAYATKLDEQLAMLTEKQTAVNTYVDGVSDAYNAFISRPKPVSDQYTKIENAIRKIAMDSLGADEEDLADKLEITKMDFANGVYSVELKMDREDESPLLTMPTKLIEELRGLDIVQDVKYEGYTIDKEQTEGEEEKPVFDEDGNQTGTEGGTEAGEKEVVKMSLTITVKGGKLDMSQFQTEEAEAEAEAEANGEAAQ
jgi:type IV pilus assembly protein PilM